MGKVLLYLFVFMGLVSWLIGEESFLVFYLLLALLIHVEMLERIAVILSQRKG